MHGRSTRKSQSALEYLISHVWAFIVIVVVLGVLYSLGFFSYSSIAVKAPTGSCAVIRAVSGPTLQGECQGQLPEYVAQFNGQSGDIPTSTTPTVTGGITMSTWVNLARSGAGTQQAVLSRAAGTSDIMEIETSNVVRLSLYLTGGQLSVSTSTTLSPGTWYNLVETYNVSSGGSVIYINGANVLVSSGSGTFENTGVSWEIGSLGAARYFTGSIANVQIYNASLSATEVKALYLEGIGGAPIKLQNLVGWWPLNGDAYDYSGYGNNGQVNSGVSFNGTWTSSYSPP